MQSLTLGKEEAATPTGFEATKFPEVQSSKSRCTRGHAFLTNVR